MRPVRTKHSNLKLIGDTVGGEVGDLYAETSDTGWIRSVWQPTPGERAAIARGANLAVYVAGSREHFPPINVETTDIDELAEDAAIARLLRGR